MPTHDRGVKNREKRRKEAAKGCQNLTSFFCYHYQVIKKMFFFLSLSFFPNLLCSLYLNLIMNSITRSLNIVAILTKNRDRKQMFLSKTFSQKHLFSISVFCQDCNYVMLLVILFIGRKVIRLKKASVDAVKKLFSLVTPTKFTSNIKQI